MKRVFIYFLLLLFIFHGTNSFWITASFYFNQKYIAENICINRFDRIPLCNGACFLAKELKENDKKEQKTPSLKEKEIQLYCQDHDEFISHASYWVQVPENTLLYNKAKVMNPMLYSIFHPPEVI